MWSKYVDIVHTTYITNDILKIYFIMRCILSLGPRYFFLHLEIIHILYLEGMQFQINYPTCPLNFISASSCGCLNFLVYWARNILQLIQLYLH